MQKTYMLHGVPRGIAHFTTRHWAKTEPFRDAATLEPFVDGYRKAGHPE